MAVSDSVTVTLANSSVSRPYTLEASVSGNTLTWKCSNTNISGSQPWAWIEVWIDGVRRYEGHYSNNNYSTFPMGKGTSKTGTVDVSGKTSVVCTLKYNYHANAVNREASFTLTLFVANEVHSQSCSLGAYIPYLKVSNYSNASYNGYESLDRQVEINPTSGGDDTFVTAYGTHNTSGEAWGSLTVTGAQLNSKSLLGTSIRGNNEVFLINGSSAEYYSSSYTPPSNLLSNPGTPPTPSVSHVSSSLITINFGNFSDWVRNESQAYYQYDMFSDGVRIKEYWGMSRITKGNEDFAIGSVVSSGNWYDSPTAETVSAGACAKYTWNRGSTYVVTSRVHTKFLGQERSSAISGGVNVYIPYLPTLTKIAFNYEWFISGGYPKYRLVSAQVDINNPDNEHIGNKYISFTNNKETPQPSQSGDASNLYRANPNVNTYYDNNAKNGTANFWCYYATNKYSESIIDPLNVQDNWSIAANLINCALGNIEIDLFGKFKAGNCIMNMINNNTTQLPIGTMTATLQLSKNSNFSTITHQQTKTITSYGTINNLFDGIELEGSDLGWNYARIKWNLHSSSNYYCLPDIYSPVKSIEFTGIIPEIDEFTGYVDYTSGKIKCKIKESTGIPKPKLYLDVYRVSGGGVYQSFEVTNDTEYTLPYTEPGTIWYVRSRAVNALGTVYGKDSSGNVIEYTYQIPYTTTEDYDTVANPTLSAGKILYNQNCTMNFNWTNIVTNVDHVQYNIKMRSSNVPITPVDHTNKTSGYNYTFANRIDDEKVMFVLEVVLLNSFNEAVVTYLIDSNEITLDALDLGKQGFTYHTNTTYHSIKYILDTFDKNTTSSGDDNKLVQMSVELFDKATGASVEKYFIGDENPTMHSLDLTPISDYTWDNLKANHTYKLVIDTLCVNPLDLSKQHRVKVEADVNTNDFNVYPVKNLQVNITKQIQNKPTANSNVELKWDTPNKGDADVVDYIVSYRKNSVPYTDIIVVEKQYTLAHEIVPINNDDEIYIKVGARYLDWFGNYQTKWINLPVITAASTNYIYYECSYPNVEQSKRRMYKIAESQTSESLVRNVHINK